MPVSALLLFAVIARIAGDDPLPPAGNPWDALYAALQRDDPGVIAGEADAYLWTEVGPAARAALLDLAAVPEPAAPLDPLRRALVQRDLWALFDRESETSADRTLLALLARLMKCVALPAETLRSFPDNAAAAGEPAVPAGLFQPDGPFVLLAESSADGTRLAPAHARAARDRSWFTVHLALPEGRAATLAFLAELGAFRDPLLAVERPGFRVYNPGLPALPEGTRVALVRRALLLDPDGAPIASPLVEGIEVRTIVRAGAPPHGEFEAFQAPAMAVLERDALLAGHGGGLRAVASGEVVTNLFRERYHGDAATIAFRDTCANCHGGAGIATLNVWRRDEVGPCGPLDGIAGRWPEPRLLEEGRAADAAAAAEFAKRGRADYGMLRAFW